MSTISMDRKGSVGKFFRRTGRLAVLFGAPLVTAAGLFYIYYFDPITQSKFFIPCFFNVFTGLYCPGCGNTRALHSLMHLDIAAMFNNNLLSPFLLFILVWLLLGEYLNLLLGRRVLWLPRRVPSILIILACIVVFAFVILRNVPVYPFTILAPGI